MRTLRIMEGVYRRGMLEEVMLEPGVVHAVFPCLDQLLGLHQAFLALMLARRTESLAPGSPTNFNIQQLGDLLLNQVTTCYTHSKHTTSTPTTHYTRTMMCILR